MKEERKINQIKVKTNLKAGDCCEWCENSGLGELMCRNICGEVCITSDSPDSGPTYYVKG
jgi:hypothetical protein